MLGKDPVKFTFWGGELPERDVSVDLPQGFFRGESITSEEWRSLRRHPLRYIMYKELVRILRPGKFEHVPRVLFVGNGAVGFAMDAKKMFGRGINAIALEETAIAADLARQTIKENGLWLDVVIGDWHELPFSDGELDVVFANLSYVESNFAVGLVEIRRILTYKGEVLLRVLDQNKSFPWMKKVFEKWWKKIGFYSGSRRGIIFADSGMGLGEVSLGKMTYWINKFVRILRARNIIIKLIN